MEGIPARTGTAMVEVEVVMGILTITPIKNQILQKNHISSLLYQRHLNLKVSSQIQKPINYFKALAESNLIRSKKR
jgi:hypothetical protein